MNSDDYLIKLESKLKLKEESDCVIDELVSDLLSCLPNNGCLYKYRSINDEYIFNSLVEGYIYLPAASKMNDKIDTTILYRDSNDKESIVKFIKEYKYKISRHITKHAKDSFSPSDYSDRISVLNSLITDGDVLEATKHVTHNGTTFSEKLEYVQNIIYEINSYIDSSVGYNEFLKSFVNSMDKIRDDFHIFALSSDYNQDAMWAYYANNNNGFCIEYDFNKIKDFSREIKELLILTYKVIYSDEKEQIDLIRFYKHIYSESNDQIEKAHLNIKMNRNLITKREAWQHEKEWRIVINDGKDRIKADLVSKIIFDECIIDDDLTTKYILLCLERGWKIEVRHLNKTTLRFEYLEYKKTRYWKYFKAKNKKTLMR